MGSPQPLGVWQRMTLVLVPHQPCLQCSDPDCLIQGSALGGATPPLTGFEGGSAEPSTQESRCYYGSLMQSIALYQFCSCSNSSSIIFLNSRG